MNPMNRQSFCVVEFHLQAKTLQFMREVFEKVVNGKIIKKFRVKNKKTC